MSNTRYDTATIKQNINIIVAYTVICFLIEECIGIWAPGMELIRTIFKGFIFGGLLVFCYMGMKAKPENRDNVFFIANIGYLIADQVTTYSLMGGIAVYSVAHIIMIVRLIRIYKQPIYAYILTVVLTAAAAFFLYGPAMSGGLEDIYWPAVFYLFLLFTMMMLSFKGSVFQWSGAVIFMLSDLMLIRNVILGETYFLHAVSLGSFYLGIMMWSISTWTDVFRKNMIK